MIEEDTREEAIERLNKTVASVDKEIAEQLVKAINHADAAEAKLREIGSKDSYGRACVVAAGIKTLRSVLEATI